jgi:hypothetical protein
MHGQSIIVTFEPDAELSIEASAPFQIFHNGMLCRERYRNKLDVI